jgi:hypothetical protein
MALEWEVNQSAHDVEFYKQSDNKTKKAGAENGNEPNIENPETVEYEKDILKFIPIPSYFIPTDGVVEGKLKLKASALIFGTPPCANQERHRLVRSCLAGKEDRNRP